MRHIVRRHKRKIIAGHGIAILMLLATSALSINNGSSTIFFMPQNPGELKIGDIIDIDVNITSKVPINAIGATVKFPPDLIEIVGISKANSFLDLWTEDTVIKEDAGEIRFSGGTLQQGGLLGTATALTISIRALGPGEAHLYFENAEVFASDGNGSSVSNEARTLTYTIEEPEPVNTEVATSQGIPAAHVNAVNADIDGNGTVNLVDVSIMVIKIIGSYKPRYDLDGNGSLGLSDLSVLFSYMER